MDMIIKETHWVPAGVEGIRLSEYARTAFSSEFSRKGISKALKRGEILLDECLGKSGDWVSAGQRLDWIDLQRNLPKTYRLPLEVVFEDDCLAVIQKPPGIEVSGNKFKTVENALMGSVTPSTSTDALRWPRPVHRLDYSTSGLLLIAKTMQAQVSLGKSFESRCIRKRYCAVVTGSLLTDGQVNDPIGGASACSEFRPIKEVKSLYNGTLTLVDLEPITGRTHQLRIHMANMGHPIMGDQKYGVPGHVLRGKGLFLSAVELCFPHPLTQKEIDICVPIPHKFTALLQREQIRWDRYNESLPPVALNEK